MPRALAASPEATAGRDAGAERRSRTGAVRPKPDAYLDLLPYGALVTSQKFAIFRANALALRIIARGDALKLAAGRVLFAKADCFELVSRYLTATSAAPVRAPLTLRIEQSRGPGAYVLQVRWHADQRAVNGTPQLLFAIYEPCTGLNISSHVLQAAYGLSGAEARVASALARADRLTSVARALRLSDNTVRTHAKSIFRKLGVTTQARLIQLLASGPRE